MRTTLVARQIARTGKLGLPLSGIQLDACQVQVGYRSMDAITELNKWAAESKPSTTDQYTSKFRELLQISETSSQNDHFKEIEKCKNVEEITSLLKYYQQYTPSSNAKSLCVVSDISQMLNSADRDRLLKNYVAPFVEEGYAVEIQMANQHESFDPTKYDIVINATEVYHENYYTFNDTYIESTRAISHRCYSSGTQYIHIGSLMAQLESKSLLADKIYRSQDMALAGNPHATVLRPGFTDEHFLLHSSLVPRSTVRVSYTPQDFILAAIKASIANREKVTGEVIDLGVKEYKNLAELVKNHNGSGSVVPTLLYEAYATAYEWATLESYLNRDVVLALKGALKQVQNDGYGTIFKLYGHFVNNPANLSHKDIGLQLAEKKEESL